MHSTKKLRSLLAAGADHAGPIVRDPRPFVRAQLRKATPDELIAEIMDRAASDSKVRRQLLDAIERGPAKRGPPGRLPKAEVLLPWFEQHQALVQGFSESEKPASWTWSADPRKATLEFFAQAFNVTMNTVAKAVRSAKKKRGD